MNITIPELALVVLIGPSGSGKSTFARAHFKATEVLSSDFCRGLVSDDENDQSATKDAFEVLHFIAAKRLAAGRLTVIDATNVQPEARKSLLALARNHHVLPVAIVFDLAEKICQARNRERPDRDFGPHVIKQQSQQLRRSLRGLSREGFRHIHTLSTPEELAAVIIERQPLWNNRKADHGPFDIIGDIHGCFAELLALLETLGYHIQRMDKPVGIVDAAAAPEPAAPDGTPLPPTYTVSHPEGRRVIFLGDLVDRGPQIPEVLRLVMDMVAAGQALCVPGNHDIKLVRALQGRDVQITHGLEASLAQLAGEPAAFKAQVRTFLDGLTSHYVLDEGRLVVAHAGMKAEMQGRGSRGVRDFALYGETTGETDEFGLPTRYNWAASYRGQAMVVYGHTPVPLPEWLNNTINIDTGCVFGGRLTALRYPEKELHSVPAAQVYVQPARPFLPTPEAAPAHRDGGAALPHDGPATLTAQQQHDEMLDLDEVLGKQLVETRLYGRVTIRAEHAAAALEVMSRFAANPKWLIYLPPTMSPPETSQLPGLLEHPAEAFGYYRRQGLDQVICEAKHMGSRCIVIVCRDEATAQRRFGVVNEGIGICYTRTGRRFFDDPALEQQVLAHLRDVLESADWWARFNTDWFCLDCELMPWSAKAQALLRQQYATVGRAAQMGFPPTLTALAQASAQGLDVGDLLAHTQQRADLIDHYIAAYRRYCWPVHGLADLKLAPFHLLATEGAVHIDRDHLWHITTLAELCHADPQQLLAPTQHTLVALNDPTSEAEGVRWWEHLTGQGAEGMVVKPLPFVVRANRGLVQPAIKCRGPEYLRIIYGPEYTRPAHLERLRARHVGGKRSLALRELALGIEALERFVQRAPLRHIHQCVFGILALESEPIDPRL